MEKIIMEVLYVVPRAWGSWFVGSFLVCALYGQPSTTSMSLVFTILSLLVVGIEWPEIASRRNKTNSSLPTDL